MWIARIGIVASSMSSVDSDAQAFITASGITDTTQKNAIIQLVLDLKSASLWVKMKAIYPFIGGSATSHKFNLKDPRDLDAAYRLTFFGGGTHNASGYTGNGTGAYALTYVNPSTALTQNNIHISWRSNTNVGGTVKCDIGQTSVGSLLAYSLNGAGTAWVARLNSASNNTTATTTSNGYYQMSRTASANIIMQKDATQSTISQTSTTPSNVNIILLAASTSTEFSTRCMQLVTIGEGLNASEMNALRTIENTYKTNLGR